MISMSQAKNRRLACSTLAAAAAVLLAACAPIPQLKQALQPMQPQAAGLQSERSAAADLLADGSDWWKALKSPALDALIEQALQASPSLDAAQARLARAAAGVEAAGAAERPTIGVGVDVARQRYTEHGLYPAPLAGSVRNTGNVQLGLSHEFDFFGRQQAALSSAVGRQRAAQADAAAARLLLSSRIASVYLELARSQAQARLLDQQLAQREQLQALMRQRAEAGLDSGVEPRQTELPLLDLKRQRLQLDEQAGLLRHQLAALSVQPAAALAGLFAELPAALRLDASDEAGPGLDLLGRRPDVVAARWLVEANAQQVKEARAQFYPNVSLSAFVGFNAIGLDRVLEAGSRQYSVAPALRLPLFDTGRLRAQLKGAAADADAAVASYNAVLLDAVRDASDQWLSLRSLQAQKNQQQAQLTQTQSLQGLAEQRESAGITGKLSVLNAQLQTLQQQRLILDLQAQTLQAQVGLMRSLGGGWTDTATN